MSNDTNRATYGSIAVQHDDILPLVANRKNQDHLDSDDPSPKTVVGQATIANEIVNMSKNLVGGGVLSLSGGIAIYADSPRAIVSAAVWTILLGAMIGYFGLLIAKVCNFTNATTYRECWQKTMGRGALAVSIANTLNPAMGDLACATILSQTFQSLFVTIGLHVTRVQSLLLITIFALLPLCLLKSLHVLAPFSAFGTGGVIMTAAAMLLRCFDGSYQPGGLYYDDIRPELRPSFGTSNESMTTKVLPLMCMLIQAFVFHYNCPRFYTELRDASVPRFGQALSGAFTLASALYVVIAGAGYMTFGGNSDSYILNNYSPFDPVATACRLAIAFSVLLTFPLTFIGFRDGVLDVFQRKPESLSPDNLNALTVVLLTLITVTACFVTDLGIINAITGGFLATAMVFVFPALMYRQTVKKHQDAVEGRLNLFSQRSEANVALVLMAVGVVLGVIGAWEAL